MGKVAEPHVARRSFERQYLLGVVDPKSAELLAGHVSVFGEIELMPGTRGAVRVFISTSLPEQAQHAMDFVSGYIAALVDRI